MSGDSSPIRVLVPASLCWTIVRVLRRMSVLSSESLCGREGPISLAGPVARQDVKHAMEEMFCNGRANAPL